MWSSKKERSAWGECWRRSKQAIVELKNTVKEIDSLTSWAVWTERLGVNQRDSHLLTFCDLQIRCQKLYWRVWSVFLICHCASRHSSYSFSFLLRSNIVAIHILHELVYSARLFMKMASWGFCVLVFESSGELGDCPQGTECGVPYSAQFRNQICCGALCVLWGGYWRFDRCSHGNSVKFVAWVCSNLANSRPSSMNSLFQVQLVMVHVFLRLAICQQRPKWVTWEGEKVVLCRCRVKNQAGLMLKATSETEWCWSRPLTMVILNSNEDTLGLVPYGFLTCWIV